MNLKKKTDERLNWAHVSCLCVKRTLLGGRWETSAGELPVVAPSLVDVLEDFGFLSVFEFLVSKAASPSSLLQLHTLTAVHICRGAESRRTPDPEF